MSQVAKKILLVEDDVLLARALVASLEGAGYALEVVDSVDDAAREVLADEEIGLVLVDGDRIPPGECPGALRRMLAHRVLPVVCLACHGGWEGSERARSTAEGSFCVHASGGEVLLSFLAMSSALFDSVKRWEFQEGHGLRNEGTPGSEPENEDPARRARSSVCGGDESAAHVSWTVDVDARRFLYVSPSAEKLWGVSAEELLRQPVETFLRSEGGAFLQRPLEAHHQRLQEGTEAEGIFWGHEVECPREACPTVWHEMVTTYRRNAIDGRGEILGMSRPIDHCRRVERARRESEERFQRVSTLISDVVYSCRKDKGGDYAMDWISGKPERICGHGAKDIMARACWRFLVLEEDLPLFEKHVLQVAPGHRGSCELRLRHRDGGVVWVASHVECVASPKVPHQRVLYGLLVNITDRKQVEGALRESEAKHRHLFETMVQGVVYQDAGGRIVAANPAAERILGLSLDQMRGKTSLDPGWKAVREDGTVLPGSEHPAMRALETSKPQGPFVMGVYQWVQDAHVWLTVTATPLFRPGERSPFLVHSVFEDITERKRAEAALVESERRFKALHEASFGGIVLYDQGVVLDCNHAMEHMTGYAVEELVGRDYLTTLVPREWREDVGRRIAEGEARSYEAEILRRDGSRFPVCIQGKQIPYRGRSVKVAEIRDISEQKRAREAIQSLLKEKEILLAEVHHRVKNNMNVVASLLSLQRSQVSSPEAVTALQDAESRVRSMMVLYDRLRQRGAYGEISLPEYLEPLTRLIVDMFPNAGAVRLETAMEPMMLETRTVFPLGIIVNELLTNIMKYAFLQQDGGVVTLSVTRRGETIFLSLQDNGQGMPQEKNLTRSAGFGLQVVSLLVDQIGGTLRIEREHGTRFVLAFPAAGTSAGC